MTYFKAPFYAALSLGFWMTGPVQAQMSLPTDVKPTCIVDQNDFAGWFDAGVVSANASVTPAKSSTFTQDNPNDGTGPNICNFYQWASRMFLWLTSPEGSGIVLDGSAIFNVTPPDKNGERQFIPNGTGATYSLALRTGKGDEIGEVGQAGGGGVLLSQNKALVYYGVHTNDVYGYFLSGQKAGALEGVKDFPNTLGDLKAVVAYAQSTYGQVPADLETLVIELKTSWIDAASLKDPENYVTITAEVPEYTANESNTMWKPSGSATKTLALVGVHIVGTVEDHPEFVWATFEHISNAPDADYYYTNTDPDPAKATVKQSFSSAGTYNFMATGADQASANVECASEKKGSIVAKVNAGSPVCKGGIVPSNTVRKFPWGSASDDASTAIVANNTRLLSINASVRGQLAAGDTRGNYVQMGGIWTTTPKGGGTAPIPNQTGNQSAQMRGSLNLFNATMETYHQDLNCFVCHSLSSTAANSFVPFGLSHIYSTIQPLPVK